MQGLYVGNGRSWRKKMFSVDSWFKGVITPSFVFPIKMHW